MVIYTKEEKTLIIPEGLGWYMNGDCREATETAYQSGYTNGYNDGVVADCGDAIEDAYNSGYQSGTTDGYQDGYDDGYAQGQEDCPECSGTSCNLSDGELNMGADWSGSEVITPAQGYDGFNSVEVNDTGYGQAKYDEGYEAGLVACSGRPCTLEEGQYGIGKALDIDVTISPFSADGFSSVRIYDDGYGDGKWESGYTEGYPAGYSSGWTDGYNSGVTTDCGEAIGTAYNSGYTAGQNSITLVSYAYPLASGWNGQTIIHPSDIHYGYQVDGISEMNIFDDGYGDWKYDSGYTEGYNSGTAVGYQNGYTAGYAQGQEDCPECSGGSSCNLQSKTAVVTADTQTVTPDQGYDGMGSVSIDANSYGQAKYDQGYDSGYTDGLSHSCELTSAAIVNVGDDGRTGVITPASLGSSAAGFSWFSVDASSYGQARYNSGYSNGHNAGFNEGYASGNTDGFQGGYQSGYTDGLAACTSGDCGEAIAEAYNSGQTVGYNSGYSAGYADGLIACSSSGTGPGNVNSIAIYFSGATRLTTWAPPSERPYLCSGYSFDKSCQSCEWDFGWTSDDHRAMTSRIGSFPVVNLNVQQNGLSVGIDTTDLAQWDNDWTVYKVVFGADISDTYPDYTQGGITLIPKTVTTSPWDAIYTLVNITF